jgi:transposase InsO family protein
MQNSTRRGFMSPPIQVQSQLYHFKSRILALVAAQVFSVVMVSRLFGISRKTFYKYRHQAEHGNLASCDCTPRVHGSAKPQRIIDAVLHAKAHSPSFGKQRLANVLYHQGIAISPNTVQRILRQLAPPVPAVPCPPCHWSAFEALAPHALWAMDICYLYTRKHDGFDRYLITILDDHSRTVIASGLTERQTVSEVVAVLKAAVLTYGVPQRLVCDRGSQFTCSEFRRVCAVIQLAVDYAPPQYPQYKGKIERFFRTARSEMPRAQVPEIATGLHAIWIAEYNHDRIHSRVTDAAGHAQVPAFRLHWKPSAARPLPPAISVDDVFHVQRPPTGPHTRQVNAARCISYRKHSYHFPALHKGDIIEVSEGKDQLDFAYLGNVVQSIRKPLRQHTATTRKVQAGGLVKFKQRRIQLDLPKGTCVVVLREGQDYLFYLGDQVVFRMTGQEKCHPCI